MRFLKNNIKFLLILIISTIIIYGWFSDGKIISNNSEEDLNILHAQKTAEHVSSYWSTFGTGFKTAFNMPGFLMFHSLGFLDSRKIPAFLIQAILLGTIMILGMLSMYGLIRKGLQMDSQVAFFGSLFYLLNIYSMTQIWKRFIYVHMVAWAYFPLFLYIWIKWVSEGKIVWLFTLLISSLLFTNAFGNPVFLSTFWTPVLIFIIYQIWTSRKDKKKIAQLLLRFTVGSIFWTVVNFWWLFPTFTLGSSWTAQSGQTWQGDFESLRAVSKSFPIQEILLLRQSWYLGPDNDWFDFYHNPLMIAINIFVFLVAVFGILKIRKRKFGNYLIWLSLMGLFISKGTNFPFGYTFFHFLFSKFSFTTALRNSYEKFGIVLLLPYAVFFAIGLNQLLLRLKPSYRYLVAIIIITLSCGLLVFPMWTGDIFPLKHKVIVPSYYEQASSYLKEIGAERVFNIPFLLEIENRKFSWGYVGEDPMENLLDLKPAAKTKVPYYDRLYQLFPKFVDDREFPKILGLIGVSHVILHKDSIYPKINYPVFLNELNNWDGIREVKEFGDLRIYSLNSNILKPRIYTIPKLVTVSNIDEGLKDIVSGEINLDNTVFMLKEDEISILENNFTKPLITYKAISNTKYFIKIQQAQSSFILVFNDSFDKLWTAKINNRILKDHFIVNGFANGWFVDTKGDYDIEIVLKIWPWD